MNQTVPYWSWARAPRALRLVAFWVVIVQLVGYTTSLAFVWTTTRMVPAGIEARYHGNEADTAAVAMQFRKSLAEMLNITHTHLLSLAGIFVVTGVCLSACGRPPEPWRKFLVVEPFVALLVSFSAMWLTWSVEPGFAWLLEASSALMALTFYVQSAFILLELWREEPA